jgi:hypothetical protein
MKTGFTFVTRQVDKAILRLAKPKTQQTELLIKLLLDYPKPVPILQLKSMYGNVYEVIRHIRDKSSYDLIKTEETEHKDRFNRKTTKGYYRLTDFDKGFELFKSLTRYEKNNTPTENK